MSQPRSIRERRTLIAMMSLYCSRVHGGPDGLCDRCRELEAYALERLERCPFGEEKPTCASCRVHCYKAAMREKVRSVMRYAGPRMLLRHPYLALMHLLVDSRRPTPPSRRRDR